MKSSPPALLDRFSIIAVIQKSLHNIELSDVVYNDEDTQFNNA
jgi:hypothetical protein